MINVSDVTTVIKVLSESVPWSWIEENSEAFCHRSPPHSRVGNVASLTARDEFIPIEYYLSNPEISGRLAPNLLSERQKSGESSFLSWDSVFFALADQIGYCSKSAFPLSNGVANLRNDHLDDPLDMNFQGWKIRTDNCFKHTSFSKLRKWSEWGISDLNRSQRSSNEPSAGWQISIHLSIIRNF